MGVMSGTYEYYRLCEASAVHSAELSIASESMKSFRGVFVGNTVFWCFVLKVFTQSRYAYAALFIQN